MITCKLTGVHGAGKLEFFEDLIRTTRNKGYHVRVAEVEGGYPSLQLRAEALGLPIEEQTTPETQYYLAIANIESDIRNRRLAIAENADILLSFRSVCDVLAYTLYLKENVTSTKEDGQEQLDLTIQLLRHHIAAYHDDLLFSPMPMKYIPRDRTSKEFQAKIGKIFDQVWKSNKLQVIDIPIFSDDLGQNQKDRIRFCTKIMLKALGEKLT